MKIPLSLALVAVMVLPGCKREPAAAPPVDTSATATAASQSAEAPPQAAPKAPQAPAAPGPPLPPPPRFVTAVAQNAPGQNVVGQVDSFLTGQLLKYVEQNHRLPRSFAEFTSSRLDTIPGPPPGKKWVIDAANLQVKAVASP